MLGYGAVSQSETVYADRLGQPLPALTEAERVEFRDKLGLFSKNWLPEKSGAFFNANSCKACHGEPTVGGTTRNEFAVAFFIVDPKDASGMSAHPWLIHNPRDGRGQRFPKGDFEARRAQPLYGLGLLEAISEKDVSANADPDDKNKDGISGRVLRYPSGYGRFGWKATAVTLEDFTRSAFINELGLPPGKGVGSNELTDQRLQAVTDVSRFLAPPKPQPMTELRQRGREAFMQVGCGSCHTPKFTTKPDAHPYLANKVVEPYTDLLVHDLGKGKPGPTKPNQLNRNEYRTPPLWGLGKIGGPYLHHSGAETLVEAIERHEGEAIGVRERWRALSQSLKKDLEAFLTGL